MQLLNALVFHAAKLGRMQRKYLMHPGVVRLSTHTHGVSSGVVLVHTYTSVCILTYMCVCVCIVKVIISSAPYID